MSLDLKDFRGRITVETACALEAESRISGKDRQEILREIMHGWAMNKVHELSELHKLLHAEGFRGIEGGVAGNRRETKGGTRS